LLVIEKLLSLRIHYYQTGEISELFPSDAPSSLCLDRLPVGYHQVTVVTMCNKLSVTKAPKDVKGIRRWELAGGRDRAKLGLKRWRVPGLIDDALYWFLLNGSEPQLLLNRPG